MLREMACPRWHTIRAGMSKQRLVQFAQLSQVHVKNGHAPSNGLSYMACPESRLVRRLVRLAVINYFAVDCIVMLLV